MLDCRAKEKIIYNGRVYHEGWRIMVEEKDIDDLKDKVHMPAGYKPAGPSSTKPDGPKMFKCDCGREFDSQRGLSMHQNYCDV
jgi:hypothetical protein